MLLAVGALAYLLLQLAQLGRQAPPPTVAPTPLVQVQQPSPSNQPSPLPAPKPGQGSLRAASRVLEPSYTVAPGDTLGSIAAKFGTSVEALQSINNLVDRNVLSVGQKLVIPNQE
jgi:LysM repeat protein